MTYGEVFAALADPTRRHIFEALRARPKTVGELAAGQPVSRPAVSQHLRVLESARLVSVEPRGNRRVYAIKRDGLEELRRYVESFWSDVLAAYGAEIARRMSDETESGETDS
ncbi:MAG: metalloregulator ArsR/SmtB family transcription factor [Kiloniellales bacterium]|nr:metalloregulator ArsR/SmtB family transcription factor [Kiloniellales bacterium]